MSFVLENAENGQIVVKAFELKTCSGRGFSEGRWRSGNAAVAASGRPRLHRRGGSTGGGGGKEQEAERLREGDKEKRREKKEEKKRHT